MIANGDVIRLADHMRRRNFDGRHVESLGARDDEASSDKKRYHPYIAFPRHTSRGQLRIASGDNPSVKRKVPDLTLI